MNQWNQEIQVIQSWATLPHDYDGLGAEPPHPETVAVAVEMANYWKANNGKMPRQVGPTPCGTIIFHFSDPFFYQEIEVFSPTDIRYMNRNRNHKYGNRQFESIAAFLGIYPRKP